MINQWISGYPIFINNVLLRKMSGTGFVYSLHLPTIIYIFISYKIIFLCHQPMNLNETSLLLTYMMEEANELGEAQSRNPPKTGPKITPKTIINCPKLTPMVLIEGQWQCAAFSRQVLQKFKALCYREELDV